ncbi:MAG: efflux RND transporter periplasmic adaptor subunit [Xanthobacteraceae bacterium]|nr:efflux RND transporter periplasmic adaptor subunit [Xanthobacteraceae bacterium]
MKRKTWVAVVGGLVVVAVAAAWWTGRASVASTKDLVTVKAAKGDVLVEVVAAGTLKPSRLVAIGAQVSGRLTSLKVKVGQRVAAGDEIAQIDPVTRQNDLLSAQASLDAGKAQKIEKEATLSLAETALERQRNTYSQRASSKSDLDSAEATVKQTRAQIAALEAQIAGYGIAVETAKVNLGYTRITAPIDGTVLAVTTQEGQTVNAVQSAPTIVVLGQLDVMTIRAEISEADVVRVSPGQSVYFTILGDQGHRYAATLNEIEPAPESVKNDSSFGTSGTVSSTSSSTTSSTSTSAIYYNGVFSVPNPDGRLRTYMTAEVHISIGKADGVLCVPSSALGERAADGTFPVKVLKDNRVVVRNLRIGLNDRNKAQVLAGLVEGEDVVVDVLSQSDSEPKSMPPPPAGS